MKKVIWYSIFFVAVILFHRAHSENVMLPPTNELMACLEFSRTANEFQNNKIIKVVLDTKLSSPLSYALVFHCEGNVARDLYKNLQSLEQVKQADIYTASFRAIGVTPLYDITWGKFDGYEPFRYDNQSEFGCTKLLNIQNNETSYRCEFRLDLFYLVGFQPTNLEHSSEAKSVLACLTDSTKQKPILTNKIAIRTKFPEHMATIPFDCTGDSAEELFKSATMTAFRETTHEADTTAFYQPMGRNRIFYFGRFTKNKIRNFGCSQRYQSAQGKSTYQCTLHIDVSNGLKSSLYL